MIVFIFIQIFAATSTCASLSPTLITKQSIFEPDRAMVEMDSWKHIKAIICNLFSSKNPLKVRVAII